MTQPDTIVPDPYNPQAWNRYGYVQNNPINFNDPSGHELCDADGDCNAGKVINNRREKGSGVKLPKHERRQVGDDSCSYHLCSNTNLYELGWENFGQAWNIWTNPNATYGQQWLAGAYMSYWGGAHAAFLAGLALFTYAYLAEIIGFGAPALSADGDPTNEIRVINDIISRSKLVEKATKEWVYQSQGGLGGATRVLESLGLRLENMRSYSTVNGNVFNIALDSGTSVTFRTWSSTLNGLPSTPVLQFANVPGYDVVLRFHFP